MIKIYHNNSCSKSRTALKALTESGKPFEVVEYLKDAPTMAELKVIVEKIGVKPHDLIRTNEAVYIEKYKGHQLSDEQWIEVMHQNPVLIQRPIIVDGDRACIVRTEEAIKDAI